MFKSKGDLLSVGIASQFERCGCPGRKIVPIEISRTTAALRDSPCWRSSPDVPFLSALPRHGPATARFGCFARHRRRDEPRLATRITAPCLGASSEPAHRSAVGPFREASLNRDAVVRCYARSRSCALHAPCNGIPDLHRARSCRERTEGHDFKQCLRCRCPH